MPDQKDVYFVMLNTQRGGICPLLDDDEELMTFDNRDLACDAADMTVAGHHFGFEIFCRGRGE